MPYFRRETAPAASFDHLDTRPIVGPGVQVVRGRRVRGVAARPPLSEVEQRVAPRAFGSRLLGGPRAALGAADARAGIATARRAIGAPSSVKFGAAALPVAGSQRRGANSGGKYLTGPVTSSGDSLNSGTASAASKVPDCAYSRAGCPPGPTPKPVPQKTQASPDPNLQIGTGIGSPNVQMIVGPSSTTPVYVTVPAPGTAIAYGDPMAVPATQSAGPITAASIVSQLAPYRVPLLVGGAAIAAYLIFRK